MSMLDLIGALRKDRPGPAKAARAMRVLGWLCIAGAALNFIVFRIAPFEKAPFHLPPEFPYAALIVLSFLGLLFLHAARGIGQMEPFGKKSGQFAVGLLCVAIVYFLTYVFSSFVRNIPAPHADRISPVVTAVLFVIFAAQFGVLAYFGIRYLGRLPDGEAGYGAAGPGARRVRMENAARPEGAGVAPGVKYEDSPFPFGLLGTTALLIGAPLVLALVLANYFGEEFLAIILPALLFFFAGSVAYNYLPSPFGAGRRPIASFTGGGSTYFFSASWPFLRLFVYGDGLEVRVMFHRFFIPYDEMEVLQAKVGFFSSGIPIRSDLPSVPACIRYQGFGMKRTLGEINAARNRYLTGKAAV